MNILLCCAAGMSSSMLVQKMREAVRAKGLEDIKIGACAKNQIYRYLDEADILLLAPQLSFIKQEIDKMDHHLKVCTISPEDYGNLDAIAILDKVLIPEKEPEQNKRSINHLNDWHQKILPVVNRISLSKPLMAISTAFGSIMPATVIGAIFTLLNSLPFKENTAILSNPTIDYVLSLGADTTLNVISVYLVFFVAYHLVRSYRLDGASAGLLGIICFFIITERESNGYPLTYLGTNGLFGAIFIGITVGYLYVWIIKKDIRIRLPKTVPIQVSRAFEAIVPFFLIISTYVILTGMVKMTSYGNLHTLIYSNLQSTLTKYLSNNIFSFIFFQLVTNLLWFFGIHGGNTVGAITNPIYIPLSLENFALYHSGKEPIYIISSSFSKCFISGGVGSMFSLAIVMTFFSRSQRYKTLGKISLPTTFFFINEPLLFGMPIILNPLFFIPLMFITPLLSTATYLVMSAGLVPIPIGVQLPWTTPPVIYGFLQGSWKIAVWEIVMIIASGLMWFPFFRIADNKAYEEENKKCHN